MSNLPATGIYGLPLDQYQRALAAGCAPLPDSMIEQFKTQLATGVGLCKTCYGAICKPAGHFPRAPPPPPATSDLSRKRSADDEPLNDGHPMREGSMRGRVVGGNESARGMLPPPPPSHMVQTGGGPIVPGPPVYAGPTDIRPEGPRAPAPMVEPCSCPQCVPSTGQTPAIHPPPPPPNPASLPSIKHLLDAHPLPTGHTAVQGVEQLKGASNQQELDTTALDKLASVADAYRRHDDSVLAQARLRYAPGHPAPPAPQNAGHMSWKPAGPPTLDAHRSIHRRVASSSSPQLSHHRVTKLGGPTSSRSPAPPAARRINIGLHFNNGRAEIGPAIQPINPGQPPMGYAPPMRKSDPGPYSPATKTPHGNMPHPVETPPQIGSGMQPGYAGPSCACCQGFCPAKMNRPDGQHTSGTPAPRKTHASPPAHPDPAPHVPHSPPPPAARTPESQDACLDDRSLQPRSRAPSPPDRTRTVSPGNRNPEHTPGSPTPPPSVSPPTRHASAYPTPLSTAAHPHDPAAARQSTSISPGSNVQTAAPQTARAPVRPPPITDHEAALILLSLSQPRVSRKEPAPDVERWVDAVTTEPPPE